jgi:hypothetical protein
LFVFVYACKREKIIPCGVVNDGTQVKEGREKKENSAIVLKNELSVRLLNFLFLKEEKNDHLLFLFSSD